MDCRIYFLRKMLLGCGLQLEDMPAKGEDKGPEILTINGFVGIPDGRWRRLQAEGVAHDLENSCYD